LERRKKGRNTQDWLNEDTLDDTASHTLIISSKPLRERTVEAGEDRIPNRMEKIPPVEMGQQERVEAHPLTVPTKVPPSYVDPRLLVQTVKVVMEGMASSTTQAVPAIQILQVDPGSVVTTNNMVLVV